MHKTFSFTALFKLNLTITLNSASYLFLWCVFTSVLSWFWVIRGSFSWLNKMTWLWHCLLLKVSLKSLFGVWPAGKKKVCVQAHTVDSGEFKQIKSLKRKKIMFNYQETKIKCTEGRKQEQIFSSLEMF